MPGVTKEEAADILHRITGAPFEIEWIGSPGPTMEQPIAVSDLREICEILADYDWQISSDQDSLYEAIASQSHLVKPFAVLTYLQIYNPTPPPSFYEFRDWYREKAGLSEETADPNRVMSEAEDDLLMAGIVERHRKMLIHICDLVQSGQVKGPPE